MGTQIDIPKLYKYRCFKENFVYSPGLTTPIPAWEHQLFEGVLCTSSPLAFNDPYDCDFSIDYSFLQNKAAREIYLSILEGNQAVTDQQRQKLLTGENWKAELETILGEKFSDGFEQDLMSITNTHFKDTKKDFQVLCLSETYNSILMWSHYAGYHKGFCIEYDLNKWPYRNCLHRVQYDTERYFIPGTFADKDSETANKEIYKAALHKAKEWDYEKEWRMVFNANELGALGKIAGKHAFVLSSYITGVFLGAKADQCHQEKICNHFKGTNVKVYRMMMQENSYSLMPEQIQ